MPLLHIFILALVQGITEFLPVSSSGHLVLAHVFLNGGAAGVQAQDILIDIAVHVGTLASVLLYFRRDVAAMAGGLAGLASGRRGGEGARLAFYILLGSLPVLAAGLALHLWPPAWLRGIETIAWTTLVFGILLWVADLRPGTRTLETMTWRGALLIGLAQILALIPGVSRSGITMTAGRFLGYSRTEAARYSLLLAVVAISGAGALGGLSLLETGDAALGLDILLAAALAFISSWTALALMMRWLARASFKVFVLYRIALGLALLAALYAGAFPGLLL